MAARDTGRMIRPLRGSERERAVREVLSRWREGGGTKVAFCRREGIACVTLARWLREFPARRGDPAGSRPRFVEAVLPLTPPAPFEVVLATGQRVCVPHGFDEQDLARLVRALSSC